MFVVNLTGAKALNGESLRGLVPMGSVEAAAKLVAATGGTMIVPKEYAKSRMFDALMAAYGIQKKSHRVYTLAI